MIDRLLDSANSVFKAIVGCLLTFMLIAYTLNIASRSILGRALDWVFPFTMFAFVWLVFFGLYCVVREGREVAVDFIVRRAPAHLAVVLAVTANAIALAVLGVILSTAPAAIHLIVGEIEMVGLQRYTMLLPLYASCALVLIHVVNRTVQILRGERSPLESAHTPNDTTAESGPR
jgi:TRAP-type C4-dicarboxylate transport system permease small subunit